MPPVEYANFADAELVRRVLAGDQDAIAHLYYSHAALLKFIGDQFNYSEDLAQNVILHLRGKGDWAKLNQWRGTGELRSYVKRVGYRICLDEYRKNRKRHEKTERLPEGDEIESADPSPLEELVSRIGIEELLATVRELGQPHRKILESQLRDPSLSAEELGMSQGAFRVALHRARRLFKEKLRQKGWDVK